ncbi:MAG: hypothetical protein ABGU93_09760 [Acetobacterium sp.]|uniref:hypothetical protein n=1 Tax=Acetobacterium sp. TaxID=1872094 RepID=UPI003242ED54
MSEEIKKMLLIFAILVGLIVFCERPEIVASLFDLLFCKDGVFDNGVFWTALSGIATFMVGVVAIWQTKVLRKKDLLVQNSLILVKKDNEKIDYTSIYQPAKTLGEFHFHGPDKNTYCIYRKNTIDTRLILNLTFNTYNNNFPDLFKIKHLEIKEGYNGVNILSDDLIFQKESVITEIQDYDKFSCRIIIVDENLKKLYNKELIISAKIVFCKNVESFYVISEFTYIFKFKINRIEDFRWKSKINDLILTKTNESITKKMFEI